MSKNAPSIISVSTLVASNAWLIVEILRGHFLFGDVLLVYWLEIGILGLILILKVYISCWVSDIGYLNKIGSLVYATILNIVLFITTILVPMTITLFVISYYVPGGLEKQSWIDFLSPEILRAGAFILLSHLVSFVVNFIGRGEFKTWGDRLQNMRSRTEGIEDMFVMQKRFTAVLFSCIGGGVLLLVSFLLQDYTSITLPNITASTFATILFILAKIWIDIRAHKQEHIRS